MKDTEALKQLEHFASCLMSKEEIAIILNLDEDEYEQLKNEHEGEITEAFLRGLLKTKADLHESIKRLAKAGSAPAQSIMIKLMQEAEMNRLKSF